MRCKTVDCGFFAEHWVMWPGQGGPMCELCTQRAQRVAEAMGFELAVMPLDVKLALEEKRRAIQDAVERLTGEKLPEPGQGGT